jgi:asparagine synthase (glutamine-hydrolysing)
MTYAAGLVGYLNSTPLPHRVEAASERAPWRGPVSGSEQGRVGEIAALGESQITRFGQIAIACHGRIDNVGDLAGEFDVDAKTSGAVIAALYRQEGERFAQRLVGDFAILIMDDARGILVGARDWIGARPLYWGKHRGVVAFGSEVKQVLALLDRPLNSNFDALSRYERMDDLLLDETFDREIKAVMPNGHVVADLETVSPRQQRVVFSPVHLTFPEATQAIRERLEIAIQRRTTNAVRLGALISGGMDSTTVVATAASLASRGQGPTIAAGLTTSYPETPVSDESRFAKAVAERWSIPWTAVATPSATIFSHLDQLFTLHDGPVYPGYATFAHLMSQVAVAGVDVLLTGEGGDFWLDPAGREISLALLRRDWPAFFSWSYALARRAPKWTAKELLRTAARAAKRERAESYFEQATANYWWRTTLENEEREGMRRGIRVEFPFCDRDVAALLVGIKQSVRATPSQSKRITREAMRGLLPDLVRCRRDSTYGDPVLRAALGDTDDTTSLVVATARRYAESWRNQLGAKV